jgi:methylamine dehydrogenase accessory protein MauD
MNGPWLISYVLLWVVVAALSVLILSLLRLVGQLHQRIGPAGAMTTSHGPGIGERLSDRLAESLLAEHPELSFPRQRDALLVFVSPSCPACGELLKSLPAFQRRYEREMDVILISTSSDAQGNRDLIEKVERMRMTCLVSPRLASAIGIVGAPYCLWVDRLSTVHAKGITNHTEHLESLRNARRSGFASLDEYLASTMAAEPILTKEDHA